MRGQERDFWEWAALTLTILASITAVLGFAFWILRQRRRPEIYFLWRFSPTQNAADLRPWPPDSQPTVKVDQWFIAEASFCNIGDATGETTIANFVVPSFT